MSTSFIVTFPDYVSGSPTPLQLATLLATYGDIGGVTLDRYTPPPVETDPRREYFDTVSSIAADIRAEHRKGSDGESDAVHEAVDGSYWIVYTHAAPKVLEYSSNESAMESAGMYPDSMPDGGLDALITQAAYFAMCADVRDELADLEDPEEEDEKGTTVKPWSESGYVVVKSPEGWEVQSPGYLGAHGPFATPEEAAAHIAHLCRTHGGW